MATVIFYEKPGCVNNTRQKALLRDAGHEVLARDLLTESWTVDRLGGFFGSLPMNSWFNRSAPRIKSRELIPEELSAAEALAAMIEDPLLIRRPLMEAEGRRVVGFDAERVDAWIGLQARGAGDDLETCPHDAKKGDAQGDDT